MMRTFDLEQREAKLPAQAVPWLGGICLTLAELASFGTSIGCCVEMGKAL
jgi:hypothetical protein